jgi:uncharacterized membrane protein
MKALRIVGISLGVLVALVFLVAAFMPKEYTVEREIVVEKPKIVVFQYIKYLENQNEYSYWMKVDPLVQTGNSGIDGSVGYVSTWESKMEDVGKGEQEIKAIVEGERVEYEIRFKEPYEAVSTAFMETRALSDTQTTVVWGFKGRMGVPANLLIAGMKSVLGQQIQEGLDNMKKVLEEGY